MPRIPRIDLGNTVYHVINRSNARVKIFHENKDYQLFEVVLTEAQKRTGMRILAYCIMPNHWHLVLHPKSDGDLQAFMSWLTMTHTQRWHATHGTIGSGHLYQGRYKSFMVQTNEYFLQLCRYVERNPLRARFVTKAEDWRWSSLWRRERGNAEQQNFLSSWPEEVPKDYIAYVNLREADEGLKKIRYSVNRGTPYGSDIWVARVVKKYELESTLRDRGRPKKGS